jgi:transcriptional regulator with XRE-family HTH domain
VGQGYISRLEGDIIQEITAEMLWRLARELRLPMETLFAADDDAEALQQGTRKRPPRAAQTPLEKAVVRAAAMWDKPPESVHRFEDLPPVNLALTQHLCHYGQ